MFSNKIPERLKSFQNLLAVAGADGVLQEDEKEVLIALGADMGLTPEDLKPIINADALEVILHDTKEANLEDLADMLMLAASDGVIFQSEYEICQHFATLAGISAHELDDLLQIALQQTDGEDQIEWIL